MLNVLCVRVGNKYPVEYVYKLQSMVSRHLKQKHRFVCLTDTPEQLPRILCEPAAINIKDSWCKISLFNPNLKYVQKGEKCLYLDLDVIVLGSLDKLIDGKLSDKKNKEGDNLGNTDLWIAKDWRDPFNSSVMFWEHPKQTRIFNRFCSNDIERLRGDQNLIAEIVPDAKTFFPQDILSYKFSGVLRKDEKPKCKIVLFHGKPKMADLPNVNWIKEEWK